MTKNFTYRDLLQYLEALNSEELDQTVTVHDEGNDEIYPANTFVYIDNETEDRLDPFHLILTINSK
jgi:hypothetical protein